ncbi:MAG: hypothetical protein GX856_06370 [Gammaproteobacteria bacterium]|jgi:hypothetical protein|nr:hypothetical protein [Gammaproteobacteria bacterium]
MREQAEPDAAAAGDRPLPLAAEFTLPRLVVRAGLAGHRPDRLRVSAEVLQERIARVLDCLATTARAAGTGLPRFHQAAEPLLRFTTGLARGADEIGAGVALARGWELQSVLAFDRQRFVDRAVAGCSAAEAAAYRDRFHALLERSSSVLEIMGSETGGLRRDGYELVGEVLLKQLDVLVCIWDGQPGRGAGGTASVMRSALRRGLPVVWIHAAQAGEGVRVFLPGEAGTRGLDELAAWLGASLRLDGGVTPAPGEPKPTALDRWNDFVAERGGRAARFPPLFDCLLMLGGGRRPSWRVDPLHSGRHWQDNWNRFRSAVDSVDPAIAQRMDTALWLPFLRADHLATRYGRAYRGTYVLIYMLAALATLAGLSGLLLHDLKPWLVALELFMIVSMVGVTWIGRRHRWHQRWLEYRAVAEQLRQARMGVWTGRSLEPGAPEGDGGHAGASWVGWYIRACVRQLPLIHASATPGFVRLGIDTIVRLEIEEQRGFNERTAHVQERVHERLEAIEIGLLGALILACTAFLVIHGLDIGQFRTDFEAHALGRSARWTARLPELMTFVGALVPALGAALLGVRSQGDFNAYAERAADTAAQLQALAESVRPGDADATEGPAFEDLMDLEDRTAAALAKDVFAWRMVYARKALSISA